MKNNLNIKWFYELGSVRKSAAMTAIRQIGQIFGFLRTGINAVIVVVMFADQKNTIFA